MSQRTIGIRTASVMGVLAALAGCAGQSAKAPTTQVRVQPGPAPSSVAASGTKDQEFGQTSGEIVSMHKPGSSSADAGHEPPRMYHGTGNFVKIKPLSAQQRSKLSGGEFTLNFEATDLQEVVKAILGDLLKENYFIDPKVTGSITIQTSRPLRKDELLPTLENLLRMNGAALIRSAGVYKVLPQSDAVKESDFSSTQQKSLPRGYGIRVMPLRYVSAKEVVKLIQPFAPTDAPPVVDEQRNLIVLAGTAQELANLADMIDTFDVDYLNGMSTGLFKLDNSQAKTMATELEKVFGEKDSPISGMIKVVPIERLNSLMVIASRPSYLDHARDWIERLDKIVDSVEPRVYVYRVQNAKAKDLATVIGGLFATKGDGQGSETPPPGVAPGEEAGQLGNDSLNMNSNNQFNQQDGMGGTGSGFGSRSGGRMGGGIAGRQGVTQVVSTKNLKVMADESNNSLVIMASPADYKMIDAALQRLDTVPLQVYIEARVVEVTLGDNLEYGLGWTLNQPNIGESGILGENNRGQNEGIAALPIAEAVASGGFSYLLRQRNNQDIGVRLKALASMSKLNVLSSPSLMVLDNQTAKIEVVNEIPILTTTQQSFLNQQVQPGVATNFLGSVQYKKAGVILEVTPRVNAGGRITLEIMQEVSEVDRSQSSAGPTGNVPFINRNLRSVVTVQSGETLALGGLIKENKSASNSGIPFLKDVPILGNLFKSTTDNVTRTELIVVMTPKAVRSDAESRQVTQEFRERLHELNRSSAGELLRRDIEPKERGPARSY